MKTLITAVALLLIVLSLSASDGTIATTTPEAVRERLESKDARPLVVDVRELSEYEAGHIGEALLVPLGTVKDALTDVPKDREIVLVCRSGRRSARAYEILAERGFTNLRNMQGGMLAWEKLGYPVVTGR